MPCNCAVADCRNWAQNVGLGDVVISYKRFPKDGTLRTVWITQTRTGVIIGAVPFLQATPLP